MPGHDDSSFKIQIGDIEVNVIFIHFMPSDPDWFEKNHCHSTYELHFIPGGRGSLEIEGKRYPLLPNTFYLTGPGVYHKQITDKTDPMSEYCINFEIKPKRYIPSYAPGEEVLALARLLKETRFWFGKDEYGCIGLFERIRTELDKKLVGYYSAVCNQVFQILIHICRSYSGAQKALYPPPAKGTDDERIKIIDGLLFHHYAEALTIGALCRELKLSRRQFQRIFSGHYQMPFKQKLISVRLENAKDLLRSTGMCVGAVAEQTGFSSAASFGKTFKSYTGVTPLAYRRAFLPPGGPS